MFGKTPFQDLENRKVCYDYMYLNDYEALNALSSAAGGIQGDNTIEITKDQGGSVGLKFSIWGAGLSLGGNGSRKQRQQFVNRLTIHSQMRNLFEATKASVAEVENEKQVEYLKEGYLVRFDGYIEPLPGSAQIVPSDCPQPFWLNVDSLWQRIRAMISRSNPERKERERRRSMIGDQHFIGLAHVVDNDGKVGSQKIGLELAADYVMIDRKENFARRATVFGWVTCIPYEDFYELAVDTTGSPHIVVSYKALAAVDDADGVAAMEEKRDSQSGSEEAPVPARQPDLLPHAPAPDTSAVSEAVGQLDTWKMGEVGTIANGTFQPQKPEKLAASVRPICIYR
jgi:hypothetical protein